MVSVDGSDVAALIEVLEHGRDGQPRWLVLVGARQRSLWPTVEAVTTAATTRGFVAAAVDDYLRARVVGDAQFAHRTLLLIDTSIDARRAHSALLHACVQSPRPHVLLTVRDAVEKSRPVAVSVREARATYAADRLDEASPQVRELIRRALRASEFIARGRHAAAERLLREMAQALRRRGADRHAARVEITRGRLLLERGKVVSSIDSFERAAHDAQRDDEALALESRLWQATARIQSAAFVDAEGICRAVLEAPRIDPAAARWARAVLADALIWHGRVDEIDDVPVANSDVLEPSVLAAIHHVRVRWMVARGDLFAAGSELASLRSIAARTADPTVAVITCQADLELAAQTGDLLRIRQAFGTAVAAARRARMPFRTAWCRLVWVDAAQRAGATREVASEVERLQRFSRVAPPLLVREIDRRLSSDRTRLAHASTQPRTGCASVAAALVRASNEVDDDGDAIRQSLTRISYDLQTSRVDLHSNAAGPPTLLFTAGEGLQSRLASRVVEAGFAIGPERQAGGWELALPVRCGSRIIGAIAARWPIDRIVPAVAVELLELVAAIVAPRLDNVQTTTRDDAKASIAIPELLGVSEAIEKLRRAIVRAAAAPFAVLIEGESGAGKELAARAVHQLSVRRERRFCDLNCAALPDELLESELFGHARGAFSGAVVERTGLFEEADGGTLFLDEVADLSVRAQAKLLRAIQQQEVRRVGESFSRKIDVRLIAAANRDMRGEAAAGRFRSDLLYRLDVVRIHIPPLRDRPADIPILAEHCWRIAAQRIGSRARLSPAILAELARYHWPGNVRELQNVIASLAVGAPPRGWVRSTALPTAVATATPPVTGRLADARDQFERRFIEVALARAGGNRAQAARALGISRQGLAKILTRLGHAPAGKDESC